MSSDTQVLDGILIFDGQNVLDEYLYQGQSQPAPGTEDSGPSTSQPPSMEGFGGKDLAEYLDPNQGHPQLAPGTEDSGPSTSEPPSLEGFGGKDLAECLDPNQGHSQLAPGTEDSDPSTSQPPSPEGFGEKDLSEYLDHNQGHSQLASGTEDSGPSTSKPPSLEGFEKMVTYVGQNSPMATLSEGYGPTFIGGDIDHSILSQGKDELKVTLVGSKKAVQFNRFSEKTEIKLNMYIRLNLGNQVYRATEVDVGVMYASCKYTKAICNKDGKSVIDIDGSLKCKEVKIHTTNPNIEPILFTRIAYKQSSPINLRFNTLSTNPINFGNEEEGKRWVLIVRAGELESAIPIQVLSAIREPNRLKRNIKRDTKIMKEDEQDQDEHLNQAINIKKGASASKKRKLAELAQAIISGAEMLPEHQLDDKIIEAKIFLEVKRGKRQI